MLVTVFSNDLLDGICGTNTNTAVESVASDYVSSSDGWSYSRVDYVIMSISIVAWRYSTSCGYHATESPYPRCSYFDSGGAVDRGRG